MYEQMRVQEKPPLHGGAAFGVAWKDLMPSLRNAWNSEAYDEDKRVNRKVYERTASQLAQSDQSTPTPPLKLRAILTDVAADINRILSVVSAAMSDVEQGDGVDLSDLSVHWNDLVAKANPLVIGPVNVGMSDEDTNALHSLISNQLLEPLEKLQAAFAANPGTADNSINVEPVMSNDISRSIIMQIKAKYYKAIPYGAERRPGPAMMPPQRPDYPALPPPEYPMALVPSPSPSPSQSAPPPRAVDIFGQRLTVLANQIQYEVDRLTENQRKNLNESPELTRFAQLAAELEQQFLNNPSAPEYQIGAAINRLEGFVRAILDKYSAPSPAAAAQSPAAAAQPESVSLLRQPPRRVSRLITPLSPAQPSPIVSPQYMGTPSIPASPVQQRRMFERLSPQQAAAARDMLEALREQGAPMSPERIQNVLNASAAPSSASTVNMGYYTVPSPARSIGNTPASAARLSPPQTDSPQLGKRPVARTPVPTPQQQAKERARVTATPATPPKVTERGMLMEPDSPYGLPLDEMVSSSPSPDSPSPLELLESRLARLNREQKDDNEELLKKIAARQRQKPGSRLFQEFQRDATNLVKRIETRRESIGAVESEIRKLKAKSSGKGRWTDYTGPVAAVAKDMGHQGRGRIRGGSYRDTPMGNTPRRSKQTEEFGVGLNFDDSSNDPTETGGVMPSSEMLKTEIRDAHHDPTWKGLPKSLSADRKLKKMRKGHEMPRKYFE